MDTFTSADSMLTWPNGTMVVVGVPSLIVLIWTVTGIVGSLVLKNKSPPVMNTPSDAGPAWSVSIKKDWASGSYQAPVLVELEDDLSVLVLVVWLVLSLVAAWVPICLLSISGVLIARTCSSTLAAYPVALYSVSAELSPGSKIDAFVCDEVSLIVFVPTVNLGFAAIVGSGIWIENSISPFSSVTNSVFSTTASAVPSALTITIPFLI